MGQYVLVPCEAGHIGFQPKNDDELAYLEHLQQKSQAEHKHVSVELALSGKHGLGNLIEHSLQKYPNDTLAKAIEKARMNGQPVGAVVQEFAKEGAGQEQRIARNILHNLGNMIGAVIRDYAVLFKATGGIYLTGSVALGLADYFVRNTDFTKRFVHRGAVHDTWVSNIPIFLVTDPHITVKGALSLSVQPKGQK